MVEMDENVRRFGKLHVGWGVRVWQQQGARGGGRGQAEGTRARGTMQQADFSYWDKARTKQA